MWHLSWEKKKFHNVAGMRTTLFEDKAHNTSKEQVDEKLQGQEHLQDAQSNLAGEENTKSREMILETQIGARCWKALGTWRRSLKLEGRQQECTIHRSTVMR